VDIEHSSNVVASDFALVRNRSFQACLAQAFESVTAPSSQGVPITISGVHVAPMPATRRGASLSFGMRMDMLVGTVNLRLPMTLGITGYGVGRDELSLVTYAIGQPFPAQTEQQLASLLINRALAHPH
jgi:hypothetical protein